MIACPRCGGESPDGSLHCVQCGARLGEAPHQATQFGMAQQRPAGPNQKGPQTTQFGAEDLARLAAATSDEDDAPAAPETPKPTAPTPTPSLMAGLPRPRVSSAPSPLTEGLRQRVRPPSQSPSARSTVMGMPIYADLAPTGDPSPKPSEPAETAEGPATLTSLESFDVAEAPAAPEATEPTPHEGAPRSIRIAPELSEAEPPAGRVLTEDEAPATR